MVVVICNTTGIIEKSLAFEYKQMIRNKQTYLLRAVSAYT